MKLNNGFNKKIEPIINSSTTLTEWFDKNQDMLSYYGLDHPGCLMYEQYDLADADLRTLGRMANHCLTVLECYNAPYIEKISYAIKGMTLIYNTEYDKLSDVGKSRLYITNRERLSSDRIAYYLDNYFNKQL